MSLRLNALTSIFAKVCLVASTLGLFSAQAIIPFSSALYTFEPGSSPDFYFHANGNTNGPVPKKSWTSPSTTVAYVGKSCCLFSYGMEDEYENASGRPNRFSAFVRVNTMGTGLNPGVNAYSWADGETRLNANGTTVSQFTLEFAEKYNSTLYLTGGLTIKTHAGQNQVFLNNEETPTYFPGISHIELGQWYKISVNFDYAAQTTSWFINEIEGETSPIVKSFQGGNVLGIVKVMMSGTGNNNADYIDAEIDNVSLTQGTQPPARLQSVITNINGPEPLHIQDGYTLVDRVIYGIDRPADEGIVYGPVYVSPSIYRASPETLNCYDFSPTSQTSFVGISGWGPNFTATRKACTRPISIYVAIVGAGIPVTAYIAGTSTVVATTNTDAGGYANFNLSPGSYEFQPTNPCFDFFPNRAPVTTSYYEVAGYGINAGTKPCNVTLSGTVSGVGSGSPVTVRDASNNIVANPTTNASGFYSTSLAPGTYTVTPTASCYSFSPTSRSVTFDHFGSTGNNFSGTLRTYTLSVSAPNGNVTRSAPGPNYGCGSSVTLTASTPFGRYLFSNWSGDASGTNNQFTVAMNGNRSVTANYTGPYYQLISNATTGGTVEKTPPGSIFGTGYYLSGNPVTVTASPSSNYNFTAWSGASTATTLSTSVSMTSDKTITGNFAIKTYSLTVNATNCTYLKTPNRTSYDHGSTVDISVSANSGHVYTSWADGVTANPRRVTMTSNTTLSVTCAPIITYSLTTNVLPAGGGSVTPTPTGPNHPSGTTVSLKPNPNTANGYYFVNWTGDLTSASDPGSITMNANKSVTANFAIRSYTLTVNATNATFTKTPDQPTYTHGSPVDIQINPSPGYEFTSWSDGNTTNPRRVTMTTATTLSVTCTLIPFYGLTLNVLPAGSGSVTPTPTGPNHQRGTTVSLKPNPNTANGYYFVNWTGDLTSTSDPGSITMNSAKTVTANFAIRTYTLTVNATNATFTKTPDQPTYTHGSPVDVQINPSPGFEFISWSDGNTTNPRRVIMTANTSLAVTCAAIPTYTLSVTVTPAAGGSVTPSGGTYARGTPVTLNATVNPGYTFTGWSGAATGTTLSTTVIMDANKAVTATFAGLPRTLTLSYLNGSIAKSPLQATHPHGSTVTLIPQGDPHYTFLGWGRDAGGAANPLSVLMDRDKTVEAIFGLTKYPLTTAVSPSGSGSVVRTPNAAQYDYGTPVELKAENTPGFRFSKWTGDATQSYSPITVTMDRAKNITAVFTADKARLTISPTPVNGSIKPHKNPDASGYYTWGDKILLTPVPVSTAYKFLGWTGAASGTTVPYPLIMDGDKTVSATFGLIPYYTLTLTQPANGTLKASPPNTAPYKEGTKVTLSYVAGPNATFGNWTIDASGTTRTYELIMNSNKTVSAVFTTAPPVSLTVVNAAGSTTTTVNQNTSIPILTTIPVNKGFDHWKVTAKQHGKVNAPITNPTSATLGSIKLSGGNATVTAIFSDPTLEIATLDEASGVDDISKSRPRVRIRTKNSASITNIKFRYYFKMECSRHPDLTWTTTPPNGWSATLVDADNVGTNPDYGGNWYVEFGYTGTLDGNREHGSPQGLVLSHACGTCGVWNRNNDPSGPKTTKKWVTTRYVPVYLSGSTTPIPPPRGGVIPPLQSDKAPDEIPSDGTLTYTVPGPEPTPDPQPNETFDQAFPQGDIIANGSFENDTVGWQKWGAPDITMDLGYHSPAQGAFDGTKYLKVSPTGAIAEGVQYEISETSPAYAFLSKKTVTLAARIRKPSEVAGTVAVRLVLLDGAGNGLTNPACTLNETWQFCTQTFTEIAGVSDAGVNKYRFAIVEATTGQNLPFHVDAVSLSLGEQAQPAVVTTNFTSTRHSLLQSLTFLPEENFGYDPLGLRLVVSNVEYDNLGRESKAYLPFSKDCAGDDCNPYFRKTAFDDQVSQANLEYVAGNSEGLPNAGGIAYTEKNYEHDQATTITRTGKPGTNFGIQSGNTVENFYSGVNSLNIADLGTNFTVPLNRSNPLYAFNYTEDENGHGAMDWKNSFGQVVRSAAPVTINGVEKMVVTEKVYDERGRVVKVIPPLSCIDRSGASTMIPNCVNPVQIEYDDEDHSIKQTSSDDGTSQNYFDYLGRIRISQQGHQVASRKFTVSRFDQLGRVTEVGEYTDKGNLFSSSSQIQSKARDLDWPRSTDPEYANYRKNSIYFYDKMPKSVPDEFVGLDPLFKLYPDEMEITFPFSKGMLCAVVTMQPPIVSLNETDIPNVGEISSVANKYDKFGKVIETYTYNGFITNAKYKLQKSATLYDETGRISETRNFDKAEDYTPSHITKFRHDDQGRVKEVTDGSGKSIAKYEYYKNSGKLKLVTLDANAGDPDYITIKYTYHINGKIENILVERPILGSSKILYTENLYFDQPTALGSTPQYNGNVAQIKYFLSQLSVPSDGQRQSVYSYDELDRLTKVAYEVLDPATDAKDSKFDAVFGFDENGRIQYQRSGSKAVSASGGEYGYEVGTNRLAYVNNGIGDNISRDRSGSLSSPNFRYDAGGQMVEDRSKKMTVQYDFRGLPLAFTYKDASSILHQMVVRYDHSGSRISKLDFVETSGSVANILVDPNPNRESDYSSVKAALDKLKVDLATLNGYPDKVYLNVVYENPQYRVPLSGIGNIKSIPLKDGIHKISISVRRVKLNSDEYWELVGGRKMMSYASGTHYSGVGNEIRHTGSSPEIIPVIYTSLPQGLGRFNAGSNEMLFNITNHLGSTVLGVPSNNTLSYDAFDFSAYGIQDQLSVSHSGIDKITESFTGKEFDEKISLQYFGARYFDPEIALWISPDAAKQFASPYAYNPNPVNSIDADGNWSRADDEAFDKADQLLKKENLPGQAKAIGYTIAGAYTAAIGGAYGLGIMSGFYTTAQGFLFGSLRWTIPIALPVIRFGGVAGQEAKPFATNFLKLASTTYPRMSQFMTRYGNAVLPRWNPFTQMNIGFIKSGSTIDIGITGPQGGAFVGGLLQINANPATFQLIKAASVATDL